MKIQIVDDHGNTKDIIKLTSPEAVTITVDPTDHLVPCQGCFDVVLVDRVEETDDGTLCDRCRLLQKYKKFCAGNPGFHPDSVDDMTSPLNAEERKMVDEVTALYDAGQITEEDFYYVEEK